MTGYIVGLLAGTAEPFASIVPRVSLGVLMSVRTMSLDGVLKSSVATPSVFGVRNQLKVGRVNAVPDSAEVIPLQPGRRFADEYVMSIDEAITSATDTEVGVTFAVQSCSPDVTTVCTTRIDLAPEAGNQGRKLTGHRVTSGVMEPGVGASRLLSIISRLTGRSQTNW